MLSSDVSQWPALDQLPVHLYKSDRFQRPYPFQADTVIGIDEVIQLRLDAFACHESQVYEAMPWWRGVLDQVPADPVERRAWFERDWMERHAAGQKADRYRERVIELYGEERGRKIEHVEAFEICEYGAPVAESDVPRMFPFFER